MSTTVAPQVSTRWVSSGTGEKVDMGAATAPASAAPKMAATASGRLPMSTPTASPGATRAAIRARPMRRASAPRRS